MSKIRWNFERIMKNKANRLYKHIIGSLVSIIYYFLNDVEDVTKRYSSTVSLNLSASEEEYSPAKLVYIPPFSIVENATVKSS